MERLSQGRKMGTLIESWPCWCCCCCLIQLTYHLLHPTLAVTKKKKTDFSFINKLYKILIEIVKDEFFISKWNQ